MKQFAIYLAMHAAAGIIIGCPFGYIVTQIADLFGI